MEPVVVLEIQDTGHRTWFQPVADRNQPILSTQLAYLVTNILSDEAAPLAQVGSSQCAGNWPACGSETGQHCRRAGCMDNWIRPQMVIGVWIRRLNTTEANQLSTQLPAALWHALMQYAHRDLPSLNWIKPNGINSLEVCDPSGLLPSPYCPTFVSEIFLSGTEPIQMDNLYRSVQINRETGLLATINAPSELVEERIYIQVPPEAIEWARQAGVPTPPETYDLVSSATQNDPNVMITSPGMFAVVGGEVSITGIATGESFSRYRIQIGQGLNPLPGFKSVMTY